MSSAFVSTRDLVAVAPRIAFRPWQLIAYVELVLQIRRERRQLARLGPMQLADLGIDSGRAMREARRGLFDVPAERLAALK